MTLQQAAITHHVQLKDRGGNTARLQFKSNGFNTTQADGLSANFRIAMTEVSVAKIVKIGYTVDYIDDDISVDDTNGEVEERAVVTVALEQAAPPAPGQTPFANIIIPAPYASVFQATSGRLYNVVDPSFAGLQGLLSLFQYGAGILPALTLSDGQYILDPTVQANVFGKREHRGSRKG